MRLNSFLREASVQDALNIDEPEIGKKYDDAAVEQRKKKIQAAIDELEGKKDDEAKEAMMADLNDKLDKWNNVDSETAAPDPPPKDDKGSMEKDDPGSHDDPEPSEQPRGPEKEREAEDKQGDEDREEDRDRDSREEDQDDAERNRANKKQRSKQKTASNNESRLIKTRIKRVFE